MSGTEPAATGGLHPLGRLALMTGVALGVLAPTLHNSTLVRAGAELGMDGRAQSMSQGLVVGASLAGLFVGGRAVDVHGTRRVLPWSLTGACAGGVVLASAAGPWQYGAGLVIESASVMGVVVGMVAAAPLVHWSGRLSRAVASAFAVLAVALVAGAALALAADRIGGWRAVEAVPPLVSAALLPTVFRLLPMTSPPARVPPPLPAYRAGTIAVVLLGALLQAAPLRDWLDAEVIALLAVALGTLTMCCLPVLPSLRGRPRRRRRPSGTGGNGRRVAGDATGAAVVAGGVWGLAMSALATVLLVLLTEGGGEQAQSLVAWAGFGAGFAAAGLYGARRALEPRPSSAIGLTLAAVSIALLPVLPHDHHTAATVIASLLAVAVGFGVVLAQIPWAARFLAGLPAEARGAAATAYPAAVVLGGAAVTGIPYDSVISQATRTETTDGLLWITVTVLALAAVVLGRSAVAIAVAAAAAAQYLLVTVLSDDTYARRPLSLAAFVVSGAIVGLAVWTRGRQTERLARALAGTTALQQAVLRPLPARAGDLELSGFYRPATADFGIGGDFYDVASTSHGTRVLIGDVRGKGLQAVRTVADVLGCFRSQAHETADLAELAARLDRHIARTAVGQGDGELFATALLLERPDGSQGLNALNCGHLPPVAIGPGRRVEEVPLPAHLPMGLGLLGTTAPRPTPVHLPRGTVLLLYTDGLSEARNASGVFYPLTERLAALPPGSLRDLVTRLGDDLGQWSHHLTDDVALVALAEAEPPGSGATDATP
ncbi:PP2C family protein-serine/threonine phosphatase [Streptomyces sp. NPDC090306]|uniref:PP2C family protein-serine/threonine phosphatase n=1 Tax=Streptomyces sp. NPDC090306 TaxID=3365961 RepID=UPI00381381F2